MNTQISFLALMAGFFACLYAVDACNEALCASRVSKCMLIKCCECDMSDKKNCSCCKACQVCLAKLYTECCSCVGLCPIPDPEDRLYLSSSIEILPDPIPDLFQVLTEEEDFLQRWTTHTYPYDLDLILLGKGYPVFTANATDIGAISIERGTTEVPEESSTGVMGIHNCSTAFFSQCMSIAKCKTSCKSMGAAKYRWFHEYGCCQCIGSTCIDYGLNDPHCLKCPAKDGKGKEEEGDDNESLEEYDLDSEKDSAKMALEEDGLKLVPDTFPDSA